MFVTVEKEREMFIILFLSLFVCCWDDPRYLTGLVLADSSNTNIYVKWRLSS